MTLTEAIQHTEEQALIHAVVACKDRRVPNLRAYLALCERDHGNRSGDVARGIADKARGWLAQAEQVAELERMAGL